MTSLDQSSFLYGSNAVFIEEIYQKYLQDPNSIDPSWQQYFAKTKDTPMRKASWGISARVVDSSSLQGRGTEAVIQRSIEDKCIASVGATHLPGHDSNYFKAKHLIAAYRENGHYCATLDPLGMETLPTKASLQLTLEDSGLSPEDTIALQGKYFGLETTTAKELEDLLNYAYCGSIGVEFSHVPSVEERMWLYEQMEYHASHRMLEPAAQKTLLQDLVEIEGLEQYLHIKFPGAKRFSVEGNDTSIVCLEKAIEYAADHNVEDVVLGMAHRGRLNTLTKVLGKPYRALLSEFMGTSAFPKELDVSGDVKYHMGYSSDLVTDLGNKIHLSLTPNPSHLEAVNPVVAGKTRAKQDLANDAGRHKVMGILIHGDAAFCGQGVVAESLVMSGLEHYNVGGIFHIVTNNQVGFTANAKDGRPGRYATEVAKVVGAPIFHVNGDDVEATVFATRLASAYRDKFGKDVVIDSVGYRKYGHNEGDEPMYTQAPMYNIIKTKKTPGGIYADYLVSQGVIKEGDYPTMKDAFKAFLDEEHEASKDYKPQAQFLEGLWSGYRRNSASFGSSLRSFEGNTGIEIETLKTLSKKLCTIPSTFDLNPKLAKLFEQRLQTVESDEPIDWATAEQLAFATLLMEGTPVRITGQDAGRGTFSHRHSVLHSQTDDSIYLPLNNLGSEAAKYEVADSCLSEYAVLGFEYGYSLVNPKQLVIWEAQFGDFANTAQAMFDQFITGSEVKWLRMSGLVMLLPHGYEGQGPEHSSARLERFLAMCAEDNMQVVNLTTPANIFHALRRQIHRDFRKPLVVMSPKSLLRHKLAVSSLEDIGAETAFMPVIGDALVPSGLTRGSQKSSETRGSGPAGVRKAIICSGKVYYDLVEARGDRNDVAIVRLEQFYPFPQEEVIASLKGYVNAEIVWCQEEPQNMGGWTFVRPYLEELGLDVSYAGRPASAATACGYLYMHNEQQKKLVEEALK